MVAAAVIGSAAVGAIATTSASKKAANAQKDAVNQANDTQLEQYYQSREDMAPWRQAGQQALGQMNSGLQPGGDFNRNFTLSDFNRDPGYDFRMQQGQQALDRSAAARGGVLSGAALKATQRYGQDYASNEYQNAYNRWNNDQTTRFNRLASVAGTGQTSTAQTAAQGAQVANNVANNQLSAGNASAANSIAGGNAMAGAANTLGNWYMARSYMNPAPAASAVSPGQSWTGGWGDSVTSYG